MASEPFVRCEARAPASPSPRARSSDRSRVPRRAFLRLVAASAAAISLAFCIPFQPQSTPRSKGKVSLVYQDWRTDWFPPMAQELLEQFHATHPSIRVYYRPDPENLEERMLADMQVGAAADVFQGCCTHFPIWAQRGYTLDLRPYVKADLDQTTVDDWDQAQYRSFFTRDGRQFGLPKYHGALALYFNKDLFDSYGVDYPDESWGHDDYLAAMKRLTQDRDGDGKADLWGSMIDISWDRIQMHVNGWNGHFVDPADSTRCRMAEPEAMAAMEWLRARMWDDKVMATSPDVQKMGTNQAFSAGRVAMVEDGSWALKDILTEGDAGSGDRAEPRGDPSRHRTAGDGVA